MRISLPIVLIIVVSLGLAGVTSAQENHVMAADNSWSSNLRWSVDVSSQQWLIVDSDTWMDQYAVGLDVHKVVSNSRRDIGTLILQPYAIWLPKDQPRPGFFDGNEAALTWRIANFNWIVLPRGRLNIRAGHFEVPFGLEHEINTNGTLRQYSNSTNLGLKADWGVSINGQLPNWQYELALTRGSGQEYHRTDDPYLVTARVGMPFESNPTLGVSAMQGRVMGPDGAVDRERAGVDLRWYFGPLQFLTELSTGRDFRDRASSYVAELNWTNSRETLLLYVQQSRHAVHRDIDGLRTESIGIGVRWQLSNRLTIAGQFDQTGDDRSRPSHHDRVGIHFRYRT